MTAVSHHPIERLDRDRRVAAGVFFVVLAIYLFTYNGAFKSNDERALFSGTDSFVKRGAFTVSQIYWDYTHVGMLTSTGEMVPNYEPAPMVLAIPFYLWGRALGAGVQGVMFMGALVGAAAAALLFLSLLELGYGRRTATLSSFVYAFATLAWTYSRTVYREPVIILAYLLALYALLRYRPPVRHRLLWPFLFGTAIGLAYTTKYISIAALPGLLILAFVYERQRSVSIRERAPSFLAALLPVVVLLGLNEVYRFTTLRDVTTFARDVIEFTTNPQLSSSQGERMMRAALGLTVSPYKGLFWFGPVLLLGIAGLWPFFRRHRWEAIAFVLIIGAYLVGYSRYLYWSGGVTYGSRYMLPLTPFLIMLAAPVFAWLAGEPGPAAPGSAQAGWATPGWLKIPAVLLIVLSVGVQVLGVAIDWRTYELRFLLAEAKVWGGIGEAIDALYMVPRYSPVFGHLQLLFSGQEPLDFAWVQLRPEGAWALLPAALLVSLGAVMVALAAFAVIWRRPRTTAVLGAGLSVATVVFCSGLLLFYRQGDARFDPYSVDRFLRPLLAEMDRAAAPGEDGAPADLICCRTGAVGVRACSDVLVAPDPTLTDYFLNYLKSPIPLYVIEPKPLEQKLLDQLVERYPDIWLARDRNAVTDDAEGRRETERYLSEHAYKLDEQQFEGWARLIRFSAAGVPAEVIEPRQELGELALDKAVLSVGRREAPPACGETTGQEAQPLSDGRVLTQRGDTLQIGLHWSARRQPAANYTVFIQLLNEASEVKAQRDRWPGDGLYPTSALTPGQEINDNLALRLDVPPGRYRLIAGLYRNDVSGYPRLTGPAGDTADLGEIEVR